MSVNKEKVLYYLETGSATQWYQLNRAEQLYVIHWATAVFGHPWFTTLAEHAQLHDAIKTAD